MEVGVFCLERARSQDTEFVRRQIDLLLNHVEADPAPENWTV
jgi:hypothetical protein